LKPFDLFFYDFVKNIYIYLVNILNLAYLKERIQEAGERASREMLLLVWPEVQYRLDTCRVANMAPEC